MSDLEDRVNSQGETVLKVIRISDGGVKNALIGTVLITTKFYTEADRGFVLIKITPITNSGINTSINDKLSINKFEATINYIEKKITIGPDTGVQIEENLQNRGIGTYAFNELILMLKKMAPDCTIQTFEINLPDDTPQEKKEMLISFFEKFNIHFSFSAMEQRLATLKEIALLQITSYYNAVKIQEMDIEKYFLNSIADRTKNEHEIANLKSKVNRMGEESFAGIPKNQLVKYTLIASGIAILIVFLLII